MDIPGAAIISATRVGLSVVSSHKRPMLEVYHETRNRVSPPEDYSIQDPIIGDKTVQKIRHQDIFVQFTLVNIGGIRAENIRLSLDGKFDRNHGDSLREIDIFKTNIPQLGPGQLLLLFRIDDHDLYKYPPEGGSPEGVKDDSFTIVMKYDGPKRGFNRLMHFFTWISKSSHQYSDSYTFAPQIIRTSLPPAEYSG